MKTVEEIRNSNSTSKTLDYGQLAKEMLKKATEIATNSDGFIVKKCVSEIDTYARKTINADCEYTAYANLHSAEEYFNMISK